MAHGITMKARGIEQTIRELRELNAEFVRELEMELDATALEIQSDARERAPSDTGSAGIRGSISVQRKGFDRRVVAEKNYAVFVEFGTGTRNRVPQEARREGVPVGSGKPHFPPPAALADWARRHGFFSGLNPNSEGDVEAAEGILWVLARSIFLQGGLKPRPFLFPALRKARPAFNKRIKALILKHFPNKKQKLGSPRGRR